jgi:hypothetical protein
MPLSICQLFTVKKINLLLLLILFCFNLCKAQNASIGFFGGGNARNISYGSEKFKHLDLGPDFGAFAEFRLSENISLQPMVEYSAQGSKHRAFESFNDYNDPTLANDVKFGELNYLMIPVLAKVSFGFGEKSPIRLYTSFGPYAAYLLSANQILITPEGQKIDGTSMDVKSQLKKINAGLEANLGISYYYKLSSIFIQAGGNYGLIKIQKDPLNGGNYSGAAALTIGYTFWFDNNFLTNGHFHPKG